MMKNRMLTNRQFAFWAWVELALVFFFSAFVANQITGLRFETLKIMLCLSLAGIASAYYTAYRSDNVLISAFAVFIASISYGILGGGLLGLFTRPNMVNVFLSGGLFAGLTSMIEIFNPGVITRKVELTAIPMIMAPALRTFWFPDSILITNIWEIIIYLFITFSITLEYAYAWNRPHNLDNAIDLSAEFLLPFIRGLRQVRR